MLDPKFIRENPDAIKEGIKKRGLDAGLVDYFLELDEKWRSTVRERDNTRGEHKKLSGERDIEAAKELKTKEKELASATKGLEEERENVLDKFPNMPFPDVPVGADESGNRVLREEGKKPKLNFPTKGYLELAKGLDLIDTEQAAKVAGSRFGYLKNEAVLLEFALVKLALDLLTKEGFVPVVPPVMIRPKVFRGMGRLSHDQKEERYYIEKDDLYLAGSAEHTIGPLHMGDTLEKKDLPRRYVGFSTCFRREAGSYGKDTRGILRVHQFDKAEMFSFSEPDSSEEEQKFFLSLQEKLMKELELPYRVIEICTGDMGWTDARQYDIETWVPSEGKYRETHSCSNTTDFQSRGIGAKYKTKSGDAEYVHMLNATAFAIGRMIIAIIENNQTSEGEVRVPKVLQGYVGKELIS